NHPQVELGRQLQDGIHVRRLPVQVNRNNSDDALLRTPFDESATIAVEITAHFQILTQPFRGQCVGLFINVHKPDLCAGLGNGFGRCNESMRNRNHDFSGLDTSPHERKPQRVGAAVYTDTVFRVAKRGEFFLKLLNHRSANESGVAERFLRYRQKFRFEFLVWCNQIQKRYFCWIGHVYFFSSSTNLKNFAGLPATIAFAGTSLVTTLPAPTIAFSPIVTLHKIVAPEPIEAPLQTLVFSTFQSASVCSPPLAAVALGYTSLMKVTLWPTNTLSSISTPSQINVWLEILQRRPTVEFFWISTNAPI